MAKRISERDLVLPALWCLSQSKNSELSTTELQRDLRNLLHPEGDDLLILSSRKDDRFSQKVRNLKSHQTLEGPGFAIYTKRGNNGYWSITREGQDFVSANEELIKYLISNNFSYRDKREAFEKIEFEKPKKAQSRKRIVTFDENSIINEGQKIITEKQTYTRSSALRQAAIQLFSANSKIICAVCSFDFEAVYGELGQGFIEIHHKKPIFTYEEQDIDKVIREALDNVTPLCSNCHRMIHRRREEMMSVEELKRIIDSVRNNNSA